MIYINVLKHYKFKKAFSFVEITIAISIFGLIAAGLFRSTLFNYSVLNLSLQNEKTQIINHALDTLFAYLDDAIKQSIYMQDDKIYWVSKNNIAMQYYFGVIDTTNIKNHELSTQIKTKELKQIFQDIDKIDFSSDFKVAILFDAVEYKASDFGYFAKANLALAKSETNDKLIIKDDFMGKISQSYSLINTAYALMLDKDKIWLITSWRPWANEPIQKAKKSLLLDEVKSLKIAQEKDAIKIKICLNDKIDICQERLFF